MGFSALKMVAALLQLSLCGAELRQVCDYFVDAEPKTHKEAQASCEALGSGVSLAEIRSEEENLMVMNVAKYALSSTCTPAFWIGATNNKGNVILDGGAAGDYGGECTCPDGSVHYTGDYIAGSLPWTKRACMKPACQGGSFGACNLEPGAWSHKTVFCGDDKWRWRTDGTEIHPLKSYARWSPRTEWHNSSHDSCAIVNPDSEYMWETAPCDDEDAKYPYICYGHRAARQVCTHDFYVVGSGTSDTCFWNCYKAAPGMRDATILNETQNAAAMAVADGSNVWIGLREYDQGDTSTYNWVDGTKYEFTKWFPGHPTSAGHRVHHRVYLHESGMWAEATQEHEFSCLCSKCSCPIELSSRTELKSLHGVSFDDKNSTPTLASRALPLGENRNPPQGFVAKTDSAPCRCDGVNATGLDSCGELCCEASPLTDPDPRSEHFYGNSMGNLCYEPVSLCGYTVHPERKTWAEASASCAATNGSLAQARTVEERTMLWRVASHGLTETCSTPGFWIGAKDVQGNGTWTWTSDGSRVGDGAWQAGYPNATASGVSRCVVSGARGDVGWSDEPCDDDGALFSYVCEPHIRTVDYCPVEVGLTPSRSSPCGGYVLFDDHKPQGAAQAKCEELGMTLVEMFTDREFQMVRERGKRGWAARNDNWFAFWIGLETGADLWGRWKSGQPKHFNKFTSVRFREDALRQLAHSTCVVMASIDRNLDQKHPGAGTKHIRHGEWGDQSCHVNHRYICQRHVGRLPDTCTEPVETVCGYAIHPERKTWEEARASCAAMGTTLVEMRYDVERQQVWRAAAYGLADARTREFWIGTSYDNEANAWTWKSDGTELAYALWADGSPKVGARCAYADTSGEMTWHAAPCSDDTQRRAYACEPPPGSEKIHCPPEVSSSEFPLTPSRSKPAKTATDLSVSLPATARHVCGYIVDTERKSFVDANASCAALGSSLAEIRSEEEHLLMWRLASHALIDTGGHAFWVGARFSAADKWWRWTSDWSIIDPFERWVENGYHMYATDHCIVTNRDKQYRWNAYPCEPEGEVPESHKFPYICLPPANAPKIDSTDCPAEVLGLTPTRAPTTMRPTHAWADNCGLTVFERPATWDEAQATCTRLGASLVEVRDDNLEDFVRHLLPYAQGVRESREGCTFWQGGSRKRGVADWRWATDNAIFHPVSATFWAPNHYLRHNEDGSIIKDSWAPRAPREDTSKRMCLTGNFGRCGLPENHWGDLIHHDDEDTEMQWKDVECGELHPFVCQSNTGFDEGSECALRLATECDIHDRGHCISEVCAENGFGDCLCAIEIHEAVSGTEEAAQDPESVEQLQASLDVSFLNNGLESRYCAGTGTDEFPYTAWHRSEPSGFVAATSHQPATKYGDHEGTLIAMFDEFKEIVEGVVFSGDVCKDALREYLCYTMRPQARYDTRVGGMRACRVCRDVCAKFVRDCTPDDRENVMGLALGQLPDKPEFLNYKVCHVGSTAFEVVEKTLASLLFPNCTTADFPTSDCTSRDVSSCKEASIPPVAMFRNFSGTVNFANELADNPVGLQLSGLGGKAVHGSALANESEGLRHHLVVPPEATLAIQNLGSVLSSASRDRYGRADQYTMIMDVQINPEHFSGVHPREACSQRFHWNDVSFRNWKEFEGNAYDTCLLTFQNPVDGPVWLDAKFEEVTVEGKIEILTAFAQGVHLNGTTGGRCSVISVGEGCYGEVDHGCGTKFGIGRAPANQKILETYLLRQDSLHSDSSSKSVEGSWIRLSLSVDLVAGHVRGYANAGSGPRKIADEGWLRNEIENPFNTYYDSAWFDAHLRKAYLNTDGSLALPNSMLIASGCFATTKLAALAIYPAAMHEDTLKLLTGIPGTAMSFLLAASPRHVQLSEGEHAVVEVGLLRPPLQDVVKVSLKLDSNRIRVEPETIEFRRDAWETAQQFTLISIDDDVMQSTPREHIEASLETSEPTAWNHGLDNLIHINVDDDDVAALVARFERASIQVRTNTSNATAGTNGPTQDAVDIDASSGAAEFRHSFPARYVWCPPGFTCTLEDNTPQRIGTIEVRTGQAIMYELVLASRPQGTVDVAIEIARSDNEEAKPLISVYPKELSFSREAWNQAQKVELRIAVNASFGEASIVPHTIQHRLTSVLDTQYRTPLDGVLSAELLAVHVVPTTILSVADSKVAHTETMPVLIGTAVAAAIVVPAAVFTIHRHGNVASHLFVSFSLELGLGLIALIMDFGDVVTDILSCSNVLSDPSLRRFHTTYLVMTVIATIGGMSGLVFRCYMIWDAYTTHVGTSRRASIVGCESVAEQKRWVAKKRLRLAKIRRAILSASINLGVFVIEDAPLLIFNVQLIMAFLSDDESDESSSALTIVFWSMLFNMVMSGVKLASVKELKNLFSDRKEIEAELEDAKSSTHDSNATTTANGSAGEQEEAVVVA